MANFEIDWEADIEIGMSPGTYFSAPASVVIGSGFEMEEGAEFIMEMADGVYVAVTNRIFIPQGYEIGDEELGFEIGAGPYRLPPPQGLINPLVGRGFEIRLSARFPNPADAAFEIVLDDETIAFFPADRTMTEILYPVIPVNEISKALFKTDSQEWKVTDKASATHTRMRSTLRFRVERSYMATFEGDLQANRLVAFRLQTPGYTPFGVDSQDNMVRLLNYTQPIRERGGLTYLVDATFLFVSVYAP
jgi:hypothetical protein